MAKSRTSEAAVLVASIAHALHGAIGITEEYDLQLLTRRLHEWRIAHGSEAHWNAWIGHSVLASNRSIADFVRSV
jgi:alkylation response protein AidB-like acyl-CoA dehydrogenase